jgi:hypothetical protein
MAKAAASASRSSCVASSAAQYALSRSAFSALAAASTATASVDVAATSLVTAAARRRSWTMMVAALRVVDPKSVMAASWHSARIAAAASSFATACSVSC